MTTTAATRTISIRTLINAGLSHCAGARIDYTCRDTYACYHIWMSILNIQEGLLQAKNKKVMKAIAASIKKAEEEQLKLKEEEEEH